MSDDTGRRLKEFRKALERYLHMIKLELDIEKSVEIEGLQLRIIEELRDKADKAIDEGEDLERFTNNLLESGEIESVYKRIMDVIAPGSGATLVEAAEKLNSGEYEDESAASLMMVLQAIARAYAEAYEQKRGGARVKGSKCPICGTTADILYRGEEGEYYVLCPFCYYSWRLSEDSPVCPHCGSTDKLGLGIYSDRAMRVGLLHCQGCGGTARVVLDRSIRVPRPVIPLIAIGADKFRAVLGDR